jgi:tRNA(fMet)-specific endonuclease VapC
VKYLLDTNTCIYALKGLHSSIIEKLAALSPRVVKIPSMVRAELLLGAAKSQRPLETRKVIDAFLTPFEIVPFGAEAAEAYAEIRGRLEQAGRPIGPNDFVIAATAIAEGGVLVTANLDEFKRVPGLRSESWIDGRPSPSRR